jgi:Electron transfer flavoprotein, alpha subunit
MAVLCLAEVAGGAVALDATAKAVSASAKLGDVTLLVCGAAGDEAAKLAGVSRVLVTEDAAYAHGLAENLAALIVSLAGDYAHITAPATTTGKNVLPRVAALLDVMVLTDVTSVVDADTFQRPIYAGNAIQTVRSKDEKRLSPSVPRRSRRRARPVPLPSRRRRARATPACRSLSRTRWRKATARN